MNPRNLVANGSSESPETTSLQKQYVEYISIFAKMSRLIHEKETTIKVEQPKGLEKFLKAKQERETKLKRELNSDELYDLEMRYRYDEIHPKIGNSTAILNHMLMDATRDPQARKLFEMVNKEALSLAQKVGVMKNSTDPYDKREGL